MWESTGEVKNFPKGCDRLYAGPIFNALSYYLISTQCRFSNCFFLVLFLFVYLQIAVW